MTAVPRLPARMAEALDGVHLGDGDTHTALVLASAGLLAGCTSPW